MKDWFVVSRGKCIKRPSRTRNCCVHQWNSHTMNYSINSRGAWFWRQQQPVGLLPLSWQSCMCRLQGNVGLVKYGVHIQYLISQPHIYNRMTKWAMWKLTKDRIKSVSYTNPKMFANLEFQIPCRGFLEVKFWIFICIGTLLITTLLCRDSSTWRHYRSA